MNNKRSSVARKIAIVTGASSGIGKAVAIYLAEQNYHVALIARSKEKLETVLNEINHSGYLAEMHCLDVSNSEKVSSTIQKIIKNHGRIDLLFNNAGILKHGTTEISDRDLNELLMINLNGAIFVAKNVAVQMKKQKYGYIINVSSIGGKVAASFAGGYAASKFGLSGYSEALTKDMSLYGVKVTNLCPAMIATGMVTGDRNFKSEEMVQIDDIIKTVDYLLNLSGAALPTEIIISSMPFIKEITKLTKQAYKLN